MSRPSDAFVAERARERQKRIWSREVAKEEESHRATERPPRLPGLIGEPGVLARCRLCAVCCATKRPGQ